MLVLQAPAKINATLEILSRRADGYHNLRTLMLPIGLYDRIELTLTEVRRFSVGGTLADEPVEDNLVVRALEAANTLRAAVHLTKYIPVGGGLGGGSSDAAAILRAAMDGRLARTGADVDWNATARALGSDVPFFLCGTGALVEGTGERVTPVGVLPPWWIVVVRPRESVATADAYRLLARSREAGGAPTRPRDTSASLAAVDALQRGDFTAFEALLVNDFHEPILARYPVVAAAHAAFAGAGATHALLSGSGSCLFAPFADETSARAVAGALASDAIEAVYAVPLHHDEAWR